MRKHFLRGLLKLASSRIGQRSSIQLLVMNRLSPALFLDTVNAYQRTAAIKAAIELDLFTAIGEGRETSQALALRCGASERGMRILSDYLVVIGFLRKKRDRTSLTVVPPMCLNRACLGNLPDPLESSFRRCLTAVLRKA